MHKPTLLRVYQKLNVKADKYYEGRKFEFDEPISGPKLLCYLLIGPSTHSSAAHVRNTWGRRCDKIIFFSTKPDNFLNTVPLKIKEGYAYLWEKSKHALKHLYKNYYNDFDWFLKADDDTYVIVENLKSFLENRNHSSDPVYFGVKFKMFVKQGFMSGGGGYVFSKEALHRVVTEGFNSNDTSLCPHNTTSGAEDVNLGKCFESVGVVAEESHDEEGRPRFFSHNPMDLFFPTDLINHLHWYWKFVKHPHSLGPECCSQFSISFHGIEPRMMWVLEMLLYHIKVTGRQYGNNTYS
ncbi:Glycoprotein-N-acetylgalactosamine 3-beta-galactosyltransferase 1 [Armadillidium nasatum]|uniref:N-acetylgalactosaminide beta-1,3-galactosyltransferase n=1 Tax=Armadillidium nasatum TaxID=96803 RepID=A0A5N5TKT7_9CRUS|nr:Glycoprotein-N-acetylgalactosamine 3-beta-galactosyltransferase 1 [Armadillidium nasatum]